MPARHEKLALGLRMVLSLAGSRYGRSIADLMDEFDLGRRTVERMLDAIREVCSAVEEVSDGAPPKRWRILPHRLTEVLGLRAEEIAEVEAAALRLEQEGLKARAAALHSVANRLRASLDAASLRKAEADVEAQLASEGLAARPGPQVSVDEAVLATLRGALLAGRRVRMRYRANSRPARDYLLEPCGLLYGIRPYLLAVVPGKPDAALWRLDRIEAVEDTGDGFTPREGFDLVTLSAQSFGVWREAPQDVVLRFHGDAAREAASWRFHPTQENDPQADGTLIVRFRAGGIDEMANHFATWGDTVEIIAPDALRDRLARLAEALLRRHGDAA